MKKPRLLSGKQKEIMGRILVDEKKHHKTMKKELLITEGVILALPLLITFGLYINLILKTATPVYDVTERLAPANVEPLLLFMLFFIIAYSIFLMFMYKRIKHQLMATNPSGKKANKA